MRFLLISLLLAIPTLAWAEPCGTPGYNGPLNANTRSTQTEHQPTEGVQSTQGRSDYGALKAQKQAYPH